MPLIRIEVEDMYAIREKGRNGSLEIRSDSLIRTIHDKEPPNFWTKRRRREGRQAIPLAAITSVKHSPNRLRTDTVTVSAQGQVWKWKVSHAAEFIAELNSSLSAAQNA